jgi:hypothetical protein
MRILIVGGTGLIGRKLVRELAVAGHEPVVVSRDKEKAYRIFGPGTVCLEWDSHSVSVMSSYIETMDGVVNLAGENLSEKRWTRKQRSSIYDSRVKLSSSLASAVEISSGKPSFFIQGSAIGIYGPEPGVPCTEGHPKGEGFIAGLTADWEAAADPVKTSGVRLAFLRTGLVLDKDGGFLKKLAGPLSSGFGVVPGNGNNMVSWIHHADLTAAVRFIAEHEALEGAFNLVAPYPVKMRLLVKELGRSLNGKMILNAPAGLLRLVFGQMADEAILASQEVVPERIGSAGFRFRFPTLESALEDIYPRGRKQND